MFWKSLLVATLLIIDVSAAVAKGRYVQHGSAVRYRQGSIFDHEIGKKKLAPNSWEVMVFGTNVTSGERLDIYANLRIALLARKQGFSHFAFTPQKKSVSCFNRLIGTYSASPFVTGIATFSKTGQAGYLDAQAYVAEHAAFLSKDASEGEKFSVFADWSGRCRKR
jgi:hypothetical protein